MDPTSQRWWWSLHVIVTETAWSRWLARMSVVLLGLSFILWRAWWSCGSR